MGVTWITPVEITPGSSGSWVDADVSAYVPAGATGVILKARNTHASNTLAFGYRKNSSTDNRYAKISTTLMFWTACGVDANRILELYVGDTTSVDVYLCGYFDSCAVFNTNAVDVSLTTTAAWTDIDLNVNDGAIGAFVEVYSNTGTSLSFGLRKNGSTDDRYTSFGYHRLGFIGVDANEVFEGEIETTAVDFFIRGYMKSGATFLTNGTDYSLGGTGAWTDLAALPDSATGGFIECINTNSFGLRKNGSSEDIQQRMMNHGWAAVECDANRIIEGILSNTNTKFFLTGYTAPDATPITGSDTLTPMTLDASTLAVDLPTSDSVLSQIAEASNLAVEISVSDTISPKLTDTSALGYDAATVDTIILQISEFSAVDQTIANSTGDTLLPKTTEASSLDVSLSVSDTLLPALSDTSALAVDISVEDSLLLQIADASGLEQTNNPSVGDILTPITTETAALAVDLPTSETLLPTLSDTTALTADVGTSDSLLLQVADASGLEQTNELSVSDTALIVLGDVSGLEVGIVSKAVNDTLSVMTTESADLGIAISTTDTIAPALGEVSGLSVDWSRTDTLLIQASVASTPAADLTVLDSLSIVLTETTSVLQTSDITVSDELLIGLSEADQLDVARSPPDELKIALSETGSLRVEIAVSDSLLLKVSDSASEQTAISAADTLLPDITEEAVTTVGISTADTLLINITDEAEKTVPTSQVFDVSDSLTIGIGEDSELFVADIDVQIAALTPLEAEVRTGLVVQIITPLEVIFKGDL